MRGSMFDTNIRSTIRQDEGEPCLLMQGRAIHDYLIDK